MQGAHGEYVLHVQLGRGAVAQVWEAHRRSDQARVAIKVVDPRRDLLKPAVSKHLKHRFELERERGMALTHPNLVRIFDAGSYDKTPFLIMDAAERSARDLLDGARRLDLPRAATIARQAAAGLAHLHEHGCVHRDIKPENLLEHAGRFVVGDLGIVRWGDMDRAFVSAGTLAVQSVRLGSWHYMAPEQQEAPQGVTAASDVYSLGVTLYELLTGTVAHPAAFAAGAFPSTGHARADALVSEMVAYAPSARLPLPEVAARLDGLVAAR